LSRNKWELKEEIEKFSGKIISGVKITESGILAAAHLGGPGSVKRFWIVMEQGNVKMRMVLQLRCTWEILEGMKLLELLLIIM